MSQVDDEDAFARAYPQQPLQYESVHEATFVRIVAVIQNVNFQVTNVGLDMNAHGASDSADITIPIKGAPDFTTFLARSPSNESQVPVEIYVGIFAQQPTTTPTDLGGLTQIFAGQVDVYSIKFGADNISFHCRSLAAALIDNRITGIPGNMKTTEFVTNVAAQYGLTAKILVQPGQYVMTVAEVYAHAFAVGVQNPRIWDMLQQMAVFDDVDVWVFGSTLYYAAPSLIPRQTIDIKYGRDIEKDGLTVDHSPLFSKKVRVEVRTYNPKTRQSSIQRIDTADGGGVTVTSVSKTVTSTPQFGSTTVSSQSISSTGSVSNAVNTTTGGAQNTSASESTPSESGPEIYKYYKPGISLAAANQFALAQWRRISMAQYTATMQIPLSRSKFSKFAITSVIRLHGCPMAQVNDMYWPRRISWSIDIESGARVTIEAVNQQLPSGQV